MNSYAVLIKEDSLTVVLDNKSYNINRDHPNYKDILLAVKEGRKDDLLPLMDIPKVVNNFGDGKITVSNGQVFYQGKVLHNTITKRILRMVHEGFHVGPMINFLENLMQNPSRTAVEELYLFLEKGNLPITEDGHFLAYKKVDKDCKDQYTHKIDNSIGQVVEMERNQVCDNRDTTCSYGLHFCSIEYLPKYGSSIEAGGRVMIVKINPRDVVSIPRDHGDTKGRCSRYEVVGEHFSEQEEAFSKVVESYDSNDYDEEDFLIDDDWDDEENCSDGWAY